MAYTFKTLPTGKVQILENGTDISGRGFGFEPTYATKLGYMPESPTASKITVPKNDIITTSTLIPTPNIPLVSPQPITPPPVTVPAPVPELSAPQKEESSTLNRLKEIEGILSGKPAFEIEQRKEFGVEAKRATQTSLYNQLLGLKAQTENIPAVLQAESEGRGRTAAGIAPIEAGRLRNAGIQATILNSQYAAATNDLANAERLVTQAVNDKFAPHEAKREELLRSLKYIKESPEYTAVEKQRAEAQEKKQLDAKNKESVAKSIVADILKLANSVASSEIQDGGNALAVQQISALVDTDEKAMSVTQEDIVKALGIAQKYLAKKPTADVTATPGSIEEFKLINGRLPSSMDELNAFTASRGAAGRAPVVAPAEGELTPKQTGIAIQLANSLKAHPAYTDMLDVATGKSGVETGLAQGNGFGDITAINSFQRMVDPGATVREGDVALLQSASSFIDKVLSDYPIEKLQKGSKLPDAVRGRMLKTAQEIYNTRAKNYNDTVGNQYKGLANANKIPFEFIGSDFDLGKGVIPEAKTDSEKTAVLDQLLGAQTPKADDAVGIDDSFFNKFLNIFGL